MTTTTAKVSKSESGSWTESKSKESQVDDVEFNWRVRREPIFEDDSL